MRLAAFAGLALGLAAGAARADDRLIGEWADNAPARAPTGALKIAPQRFSFGKRAVYEVRPAGRFGKGELFEVTSLDRRSDPFGCGPEQRVRYLAVEPLPARVAGSSEAIRVTFYAGKSPPRPETIANDAAVCLIHPYGRP